MKYSVASRDHSFELEMTTAFMSQPGQCSRGRVVSAICFRLIGSVLMLSEHPPIKQSVFFPQTLGLHLRPRISSSHPGKTLLINASKVAQTLLISNSVTIWRVAGGILRSKERPHTSGIQIKLLDDRKERGSYINCSWRK